MPAGAAALDRYARSEGCELVAQPVLALLPLPFPLFFILSFSFHLSFTPPGYLKTDGMRAHTGAYLHERGEAKAAVRVRGVSQT